MTTIDTTGSAAAVRGAGGNEAETQTTMTNGAGLPAPSEGFTDPVAAAMAALTELARENRAMRREVERSHEEMLRVAQEKMVAKMRHKAKAMRIGACASGSMLVLSGAAHGLRANAGADALDATGKVKAGCKLAQENWCSAADLVGKSSELTETSVGARTAGLDAAAEGQRVEASRQKSRIEDVEESMRGDDELRRRAEDAVRSVLELTHAAAMAIVNVRA